MSEWTFMHVLWVRLLSVGSVRISYAPIARVCEVIRSCDGRLRVLGLMRPVCDAFRGRASFERRNISAASLE